MKKGFVLIILLIFAIVGTAIAKKKTVLEKEIKLIITKTADKLQKSNIVLVSDFQDLDGRITYFGKYLSNKVASELANMPKITVVVRSEIDNIIQNRGRC